MNDSIDLQKLKDSSIGKELDDRERETLRGILECQELSDGQTLVKEGQEDPRLFLLAAGRLEVLSSVGGELEHVYLMSPGEFAGTRAFVDRVPRQATLRARGDATVYSLAPEALESLLDSDPGLVYKVMRALFRITHVNLMRMNKEAKELANYVYKRGGRY
ncbi:MAG: cyclic nucleotide-binding domain-containing protein [Wenzhouxiangellaceae bacterium]